MSQQNSISMGLQVIPGHRPGTFYASACFLETESNNCLRFWLKNVLVFQPKVVGAGLRVDTYLTPTQADKMAYLMSLSAIKSIGFDLDKDAVIKVDFSRTEEGESDMPAPMEARRSFGIFSFGYREKME
jgi:hypothetical protein